MNIYIWGTTCPFTKIYQNYNPVCNLFVHHCTTHSHNLGQPGIFHSLEVVCSLLGTGKVFRIQMNSLYRAECDNTFPLQALTATVVKKIIVITVLIAISATTVAAATRAAKKAVVEGRVCRVVDQAVPRGVAKA